MHDSEKEKINETISSLIKNFDQYRDAFNTRLKINLILNEFEDKASGDLKSFLKLSNTRYKGVKSGNSIASLITKQKPMLNQLIKKVTNDEFYQTEDIHIEKQKFTKMNNIAKNLEINQLRQKIKDNAKKLEDDGCEIYEAEGEHKAENIKFLNKLRDVKSTVTKMKEGKTRTTGEYNYSVKSTATIKNSKRRRRQSRDSIEEEELSTSGVQAKEKAEPGKLYADVLMEDKERFDKMMESYQFHLDGLKSNQEDGNKHQKFTFLTDDLKILSYKQLSNQNVVEKKNDDTKVEIKKLMRFTKNMQRNMAKQAEEEKAKEAKKASQIAEANSAVLNNGNNNFNINNNNGNTSVLGGASGVSGGVSKKRLSISPRGSTMHHATQAVLNSSNQILPADITESPVSRKPVFNEHLSPSRHPSLTYNNMSLINSISNFQGDYSSIGNSVDKKNTIKMVMKEAFNSRSMVDKINKKRQALNENLRDQELPHLEDYDRIINRNITTQKIAQQTSVQPRAKDVVTRDYQELANHSYNNIYDTKRVNMVENTAKEERLKREEKELKKENKKFFKNVNNCPRYAQQFVDQYSLRDQTVNKEIIDLTKYLGKQTYDKKKLNKKIDEYLNEIDGKSKLANNNKVNNSKKKKGMKNNNEGENRKPICKNLKDDPKDFNEFSFGNRENEIVVALVNSTKKKDTMSERDKNKQNYNEFKKFKDNVLRKENVNKPDVIMPRETKMESRRLSVRVMKSTTNILSQPDVISKIRKSVEFVREPHALPRKSYNETMINQDISPMFVRMPSSSMDSMTRKVARTTTMLKFVDVNQTHEEQYEPDD